eukprot:m.195243 g.195243  ORF g.195243 m.195243 type:complete len:111 (+) comp53716_c0_seq8:308-640(+)
MRRSTPPGPSDPWITPRSTSLCSNWLGVCLLVLSRFSFVIHSVSVREKNSSISLVEIISSVHEQTLEEKKLDVKKASLTNIETHRKLELLNGVNKIITPAQDPDLSDPSP